MKLQFQWQGILIKSTIIIAVIIVGLNFYANINGVSPAYFQKRLNLKEIEANNPTHFLKADGEFKESSWGTKLNISGIIVNKATLTTYKDVNLKIKYYSKIRTVIGEKDMVIYGMFPPNSEVPFELKVNNHKNVTSIGYQVYHALPALQ